MDVKIIGNDSVQYIISCSELMDKYHVCAEDLKDKNKNASEFIQYLVRRAKTLIDDPDSEEDASMFSISAECINSDQFRFVVKKEKFCCNPEEMDMEITEEDDGKKKSIFRNTLGFSFRSFHNLVAGCNQLGNLKLESHLVKIQNDYLLVVHSDDEAAIGAASIILSEFADNNYIIPDAEERMKRADILLKDTAIVQLKKIFA